KYLYMRNDRKIIAICADGRVIRVGARKTGVAFPRRGIGRSSTRGELPRAHGDPGDGPARGRNLDVLHLGPAIGEGAVVGREGIAGLAGGLDVARMLKVSEVVDGSIGRGATIGEGRVVLEVDHAAVERVGVARARHFDVEE